MNPAPELAPQLKQLRLSGILDSLEARNRQALDSKLAYTELLALLIGDEVARREQKKFSAPSCTTWPPGATCRRGPRCSSSGRAALVRVTWPRPWAIAPCARAWMSSSPPAPA